jgi:Flp pilus assembly protein TadD
MQQAQNAPLRPPPRRNDPCPCGSGLKYKLCHGKFEAESSVVSNTGNAAHVPGISPDLMLAMQSHQAGQLDAAEAGYRRVLEREPENAICVHYLGVLAWQRGVLAEAELLMRRSIAATSAIPDFHNNLGLVLRDADRIADAVACYRQAIAVRADYLEAWNNLGLALERLGDWTGSIDAYRNALKIDPHFHKASQNLAFGLLATGAFEEGWRHYASRFAAQGVGGPDASLARAGGRDALHGRQLVLTGEQGLGDTLFFLRFAPELKRCGASLAFVGDERLYPLVENAALPTPLFDLGCGASARTAQASRIAVGDLPLLLGATNPADFPAALPLRADAARAQAWREKLALVGPAPYIGITWRAGTESVGEAKKLYKRVSAGTLANALADLPGTIVSLQRNPRPEESTEVDAVFQGRLFDASAVNDDLLDMLALLSVLDDYVGVSNTNTHLRASLGKSAQVLVPQPPEWRWGHSGDRSPWFRDMPVYRQAVDGEWGEALAALLKSLRSTHG